MKIQKTNSKQNFNGLHFQNVTPIVKQSLKCSTVIKKLGENYDVFISQYQKRTIGDFGKAIEYGLKYKIQEITPNLFHKKTEFIAKGISEFALNPELQKNQKKIAAIITEDLINEAELLDIKFLKSFIK